MRRWVLRVSGLVRLLTRAFSAREGGRGGFAVHPPGVGGEGGGAGNRLKGGGGYPPPPLHRLCPKGIPIPQHQPQPLFQPPVTAPPTAFTSPVTALQPLWDCPDCPPPPFPFKRSPGAGSTIAGGGGPAADATVPMPPFVELPHPPAS